MKSLIKSSIWITSAWLFAIVLYACSEGSSPDKLKTQLEEKRKALAILKKEVKVLEDSLSKIDPSYGNPADKSVLVTAIAVVEEPFEHKMLVSGTVGSRKNINVSAETMGKINRLSVKEGDKVRRGQVIAQVDAEVMVRNLQEMKTSYELLKTLFEKQEKLWKQSIGSELQYLQAKNNKESMEKRIAALNSQISQATIKAPFDGTIESILVNEGEMAAPGLPICRMVGSQDQYLQADVTEQMIGKVKKGDKVNVEFPSLGKSITTTVSAVGDVINPENRTFSVEFNLPASSAAQFKPNLTAVVQLIDYQNTKAIAVPSNYILNDNKGSYVYVIKQENDQALADRRYIDRGLSFDTRTEVLKGLAAGEQIVGEGVREVVDGVAVTISK